MTRREMQICLGERGEKGEMERRDMPRRELLPLFREVYM